MKMKYRTASFAAIIAVGLAAGSAIAQDQPIDSTRTLNLPANPQVFGAAMPDVVKATAIINGEVITQTDVDQRLALLAIANGGNIPADQIDRLRQQVLRNLIDETLQIQAARQAKIEVSDADVDKTLVRVAANVKQTPEQMAAYLQARGSSIRSIRRQILGETSWRRLQSAKIESTVNVADDEVKAVIARLEAAKGTEEFRVGEIFLAATSANQAQVMGNANQLLEQLRKGGSFAGYARQFSEASTQAVGGDLGWVRPEQLPEPIAATTSPDAPRSGLGADCASRRRVDHCCAGRPQGADLRSARRRSDAQAGVGDLPQGYDPSRRPNRLSPASLRPRRISAVAAARKSWLRNSMPRSSSPTTSRCANFRQRCRK